MRKSLILICALALSLPAIAGELTLPTSVTAGQGASIQTTGSGKAALLLVGPGTSLKKEVSLGEAVSYTGEELKFAGRYLAILDGQSKGTFYVESGETAKVNFLARPSRVPVARPDVISGVAFVFDRHNNLVTKPAPVKFNLSVKDSASLDRTVESRDGIAWIKTASASREGAAQFVASSGSASTRRVVQLVASEPCSIRMKVQRVKNELVVETDPIRDCSGNAVPDGTIVTFIQTGGGKGRSTVDARIKRGIARATLPVVPGSTITVASGVVLGNEVRWGGGL